MNINNLQIGEIIYINDLDGIKNKYTIIQINNPRITLLTYDGYYWTIDRRRLYYIKENIYKLVYYFLNIRINNESIQNI